ncbi:MAG TPA: acyltransferase [Xanthobacteraceae bacterium]|nr:acyltransferase [Xanthobacteraceae bacterium]
MRSLNRLLWLRRSLVHLKWLYYTKVWGMDIHPTATFSLSARLDKTYPAGVHIGADTYIAFEAAVLAHDMTRGLYLHTRIGKHCFIGARSVILPGITIGDHSIVGTGAVVTRDVPAHCIVAGNPAKIIREGIMTGHWGKLIEASAPQATMAPEPLPVAAMLQTGRTKVR